MSATVGVALSLVTQPNTAVRLAAPRQCGHPVGDAGDELGEDFGGKTTWLWWGTWTTLASQADVLSLAIVAAG
ncbi:hypothetical protein [Dactylosporangium darangshiense]|uniref:Uncharacterized protein n=1 Tax=Dactylosporangium darangshiense TaxID=579108 RepID=A0ABP8D0N9_9ACTN